MTVNQTVRSQAYVGNGVTTTFAVPFQFYQIDVYVDGVLKTQGVHYTIQQNSLVVADGGGQTASIVFDVLAIPANNSVVTLVGDTLVQQAVTYRNFDDAPAQLYEKSLDQLTMMARELNERIGHCVRSLVTEASVAPLNFRTNPNTYLRVDNSGVPFLSSISDFAGFNWRGDWQTATVYHARDAVSSTSSFAVSAYVCIADHTSDATTKPGVGVNWQTKWSLMASGTIGPAGGAFIVSSTAPGSPTQGMQWLDTTSGIVYSYFDDGTSAQWVEFSAGFNGATGATGSQGIQGVQGNQGIQGVQGNAGTNGTDGINAGVKYAFDTATGMADPGSGKARLNNATIASATAMAINVNTNDAGNPSIAAFIAAWDASTTTAHRGYLLVKKISAPQNFAIFDITGASTNNTTWYQLALTYIAGAGSFSAADALAIDFIRTGDKGAAGAGSGDMLAANNLSDVANKQTSHDNLELQGANIASAGTINLDTATGSLVDVTGTTNITAITLAQGKRRIIRFTGILTFTNGASLVLPGGADITTAAGDYAIVAGYAAGVVRCVSYIKANGTPVVIPFATNAQAQAGTDTTTVMAPASTMSAFSPALAILGGF